MNDNDRSPSDPSDLNYKDILQKIGKTSGIDSINHQMLKATSKTICVLLTILFSYSLEKGKFLSDWKIAVYGNASLKKEDKSNQ